MTALKMNQIFLVFLLAIAFTVNHSITAHAQECNDGPSGPTITEDYSPLPPQLTMTWDYITSAETINENDSVVVAVQDGLGPYFWSVSGTGFSLESASTEDVSAINQHQPNNTL